VIDPVRTGRYQALIETQKHGTSSTNIGKKIKIISSSTESVPNVQGESPSRISCLFVLFVVEKKERANGQRKLPFERSRSALSHVD